MDLSVIIPFCNEHPQATFTIRSIAEELKNRDIEFEIIAIDNHCPQNEQMGHPDDGGGEAIAACDPLNPWLKYLKYTAKLSHWNAKRVGVANSTGRILFFVDAHVILSRDALYGMFKYYDENKDTLNGSMHLPLTYKVLESRKLIYKFVLDGGHFYHYSFTGFSPKYYPQDQVFEVPCMSCCGIMMSREIYDLTGGWPKELGIYGGGEHFMNYTLSVLGKRKWIYPFGTCYHYGSPRKYNWTYDDRIRNIIVAHYIFGGEKVARDFISVAKGRPEVLNQMLEDVLQKVKTHRTLVKSRQVMEITTWKNAWIS